MRNAFHGLVLLVLLFSAGLARAALINTGNTTGTANSATQISLNLPADLRPGDLLIAQIAYRNTGATLSVPNARWSLLEDDANGTLIRQWIYVRTVVAADVAGSSETWSVSGDSTRMVGGLSGWRSSIAGIYPGIEQSRSDTGTTSGGGNNISAPSITAANSGQLLRLFGVSYGNGFALSPAGFSEYYRPESSAGPNGASLLGVGRSISLPGGTGSDTVSASGSGSYVAHAVFLYEPGSIAPRLSWWLDESAWSSSAGQIQDQSGNGLHGTAYNGASTAVSNPGPALATDSSGMGTCRYGSFSSANRQYAEVAAANLPDLSSFTVSVWVYPRSWPTSGLMSILSKDENFEFHLKPSGVVNWWWRDSDSAREFDSSNNAAGRVAINAWTHVAIRFRPGSQTLFINGVANASASNALAPLSNGDPLQIGADQGFAGRYFDGNLDEVRVFAGALSDAQVLALASERHPCAGAAPHHLELLHDGTALTCQPEAITLRACADAACSSLYTGTVTATLAPSGWVGGDSVTFTGGSTTAQLRHTTAEAVTLGTGAVTPTPTSTTLCNSATGGSCALNFADSGFFFDVPNLLANKPSGALDFVAAKKSNSGDRCVPAFASGPRTIQFWSTYSSPVSGTLPLSVNGTAIGGGSPGTALSLNFDANARASIEVRYADAGQMMLNARYAPTTGDEKDLVMSGSDSFIARPVGFCVYSDTANSDCAAGNASCSKFVAAGDPFRLRVGGVAWEKDSDDDLCSIGNLKTLNYRQNGIGLSHSLVAPSGGSLGSLGLSSADIAAADAGEKVLTSQSIFEVGVFTITATPPTSYLGGPGVGNSDGSVDNSLEVISSSANVGRFYPAYLAVARTGGTQLSTSCVNPNPLQSFSYQGQRMGFASGHEPGLEITGHNRQGDATTNYDRGAFWRLSNAPARTRYTSVTGVAGLDELAGVPALPVRLQESGTLQSDYLAGDTAGDGMRTARWNDQFLWYSPPSTPTSDDLPFSALISLNVAASQLQDADGACHTNGDKAAGAACQDYFSDTNSSAERGPGFGGSDVRLGRLQVGNAHGSELQSLTLLLRVESWQEQPDGSGSFQLETQDSCTTPGVLGAAVLSEFTGQLSPTTWSNPLIPVMTGGQGGLTLPPPDVEGSVRVNFATPAWLFYPWDGGARQPAKGLATFGIYKGAERLIFRRELYRSIEP